jgi:hypothetical protein
MTSTRSAYQERLQVHVIWHPAFQEGEEWARRIYSHLTRDVERPYMRGPGIPVYFWSEAGSPGPPLPAPLPLEEAHHSAAFVLVDDNMVAEPGWNEYVADLYRQVEVSGGRHRLYPVAVGPSAFNLHPEIAAVNYLRLDQVEAPKQTEWLLNRVTNELGRLLMGWRPVAEATAGGPAPSSSAMTFFISYARSDGHGLATAIRDYINHNTGINTFFDAHSIPPGSSFAEVIGEALNRSALLVVQTDAYSSREWCQREVLEAKRLERPIIVVHAVQEGERRSFPYLGNVPTIRWNPHTDTNSEPVIGLLLLEILRHEYFRQSFEDLRQLFRLGADVRAIPRPPELLACLELHKLKPSMSTFVYPDPPLGMDERRILWEFDPDLRWITPTMLPAMGG